jgi:CheY-like chemotaxis protein
MARQLNNPSRAGFGCGDGEQRFAQQIEQSLGWILLVDDDKTFCYAGAKALRMAGFKVSSAPDHRLALQILEGADPIDLLITDIVMPDRVNGFALARMGRMRRLHLKVLYLTAYEVPTDEAIGPVLRKPVPLEVLVAEARSALATCEEKMSGRD